MMMASSKASSCWQIGGCRIKALPSAGYRSRPLARLDSQQRPSVAAHATILPGQSPSTQRIVAGGLDVEVPVTAIQQLPEPAQAAVVLGILASLGLGTYAVCSFADLAWVRGSPYVLGATFMVAGALHFKLHDEFCSMMPSQGAWGLWYLPGSDSFHVNWTGVAELAGGAGLIAGSVPAVAAALPWLQSTSALGLFALAVAVTPANIFMATHNAPGPGPKGAVVPLAGHVVRGALQVLLWSVLWALAH